MCVGVIHSRGIDVDEFQARDGLQIREVHDLEHLGTAELGDLNSAHGLRLEVGARPSDGALASVATRLDVVAPRTDILATTTLKVHRLAGGARTRGAHHDRDASARPRSQHAATRSSTRTGLGIPSIPSIRRVCSCVSISGPFPVRTCTLITRG